MKILKTLLLVNGLWIPSLGLGQVVTGDTLFENRPELEPKGTFTLGLDVFKNIPLLLAGNRGFQALFPTGTFRNRGIFEVVFRKEAQEQSHWVGLLGYAKAEITDAKRIERRQEISGWYGKGGMEWGTGHSNFGMRGILTYCHYITDLLYEGPAFGDYQQLNVVNNAGIGYEVYYAYDFFLSSRWRLRSETRWGMHQRLIGKGYTPYYPGVGLLIGNYNLGTLVGTTLQLHYRFPARN